MKSTIFRYWGAERSETDEPKLSHVGSSLCDVSIKASYLHQLRTSKSSDFSTRSMYYRDNMPVSRLSLSPQYQDWMFRLVRRSPSSPTSLQMRLRRRGRGFNITDRWHNLLVNANAPKKIGYDLPRSDRSNEQCGEFMRKPSLARFV